MYTIKATLLAIFASLIASVSSAHGQEYRYAFFNLPDLGGGESFGYGINEFGHVVGSAFLPVSGFHAALWVDGEIIDLGTLGGQSSQAMDANSSGEVVGWSNPPGGSGFNQRGFVWRNGQMTDLGTLGGDRAVAYGMNELGQIVGRAELEPGNSLTHGFVWEDGQMLDLPDLDGLGAYAWAINNSELVVGQAWSATHGNWRAVFWENGQITDLGTELPDNTGRSFAYWVNDAGIIVGSTARWQLCCYQHPRLWIDRQIMVIDLPQGTVGGYASAINNLNQIVGKGVIEGRSNGVGFLWEEGRTESLDDLLPPRCLWSTDFAWEINDTGQISGTAYLRSDPGIHAAFLMSPVHPTMTLLGPQPGRAGQRNGLRVTAATPGATVHFLYSRRGGGARIPGCTIQTNALQLNAPQVIGSVIADGNGVATLIAQVPPAARNQIILFQAVVQSECAISQLVVHQFE